MMMKETDLGVFCGAEQQECQTFDSDLRVPAPHPEARHALSPLSAGGGPGAGLQHRGRGHTLYHNLINHSGRKRLIQR
uniref:Uncharacterized protein n=1 Tax=Knipowitschia caucasica TaxID=637954 RepID=A0AAV2L027_KNICA